MAAAALTCAHCAVQFIHPGTRGRRPRLCPTCTKADQAARRPPPKQREPIASKQCTAPGCTVTAKSKGLCEHHYYVARSRAAGVRSKAEILAASACHQTHRCAHCGKDYQPKRAGRTTYCSRGCSFAAKAAAKKPKPKAVPRPASSCVDCGTPISPGAKRCAACAKAVAHAGYLASRPVPCCADCGLQLEAGRYQRRCEPCRVKHRSEVVRAGRRTSPSRRAHKARRKAIERGKVAGAETFDPIEILERDKWHCHICGVSTPRKLRGTYDDRAPELDHIVPLAQGGAHTRANTACACRKCNMAKGSQIIGQMRLFG
jgi:hypothetical protein